ncbi:hypothetical protein B296_00038074 [Ensete ventricosum]|uniref:Uncharacterized protein n=1 Tax=Ensete ventricosum TaxID=4639 RepID=A0A426Y473_ENSVE|nr:hypothetical protein B296_00038074 [Ensete ventricosum]
MGREAALRRSLVALATVMAVVGIWTFSLKKALVTYAFGIVGIAGSLLPDWEYFGRDFSQWFTPMPARRTAAARIPGNSRFHLYPLRVLVMTLTYGFGLYKWWMFISS